MYTWWFLIRNSFGAPMRVTIQGDNAFYAYQQAKAIYGNQMISENVNKV